jgi:hypothetical protein
MFTNERTLFHLSYPPNNNLPGNVFRWPFIDWTNYTGDLLFMLKVLEARDAASQFRLALSERAC